MIDSQENGNNEYKSTFTTHWCKIIDGESGLRTLLSLKKL